MPEATFDELIDAATPPKVTELAPERLVPLMVTLWPPAAGPLLGMTDVIAGAGMPLTLIGRDVPVIEELTVSVAVIV